ncbi:unnamed protein product [Auanema sp. JU1783]|nr:unnamed protein product [Auanema sp. JU1783]
MIEDYWKERMGGCSSMGSKPFETDSFDQIWKEVSTTTHRSSEESVQYNGWRIVRIVLISTFKDFRNERVQIHQMVEQTLQPLLNKKKLFLQIENFNSNQKASYDDPENVYLLDHLINECQETSPNIIYIHLFGNCSGFIIDESFADLKFLSSKGLRPGLTLNEIALLLSGKVNSKALYLIRNPDFLLQIPFNQHNFEDDEVGRARAQYLVQKIMTEMPKQQVVEFKCKTEGINDPHHKRIVLTGLEDMLSAVKEHILPALDIYHLKSSTEEDINSLIEKKRTQLSKEQEMIYLEASNHGSGKTSILFKISQNSSVKLKCFIFTNTKKTSEDYQKEILKNFEKKETDSYQEFLENLSEKMLVLIDDADKSFKELKKLFSSSTKIVWILAMKKSRPSEEDMAVLTIPLLPHQDAIRIISKYMEFGERTSTGQIRSNTKEMAEKLYFNASLRGITKENVEEGKDDVHWSPLKCKVLGSLIRFGATSEKVTELASYSALSVCEAYLSIIESESKGHLLISTLCLMTMVESGLSEIDLRVLLFPEENVLPKTINRKFRNMPFEYDYEKYGNHNQISALNWRFVIFKLEHLFHVLNESNNHFVLDDLMKSCVRKKFLTTPTHLGHFKKMLARFLKHRKDPWLINRRGDISSFIE